MPSRRRHRAREAPADSSAEAALGAARVTTVPGAVSLAHHLLDATRLRPVVVVTIPSGQPESAIDADWIARAVGELAEVVVVPTDHTGWRLSALLPRLTAVYGGAGRVYPVGTAWHDQPALAPLRFAYSAEEGAPAATALTSDALRLAEEAGLARPVTAGERVGGVVRQVLPPSRALVGLDTGGTVTVWSELTVPEVAVQRLFTVGQRVTGVPTGDRLDVTGMLAEGPPVTRQVGEVVLARVTAVRPDVVHLALLPDEVVAVPRDRATSGSDGLVDLFTVGEVVAARVAWLGPGDRPALRLDDVGPDAEPGPAPAILPGGPPWLLPDEPLVTPIPAARAEGRRSEAPGPPVTSPPDPDATPAGPAPKGATAALALSLDAARARLHAEAARADRSESELLEARRAVRELTDLARSLQDDRLRLQRHVQAQRTQLRLRTAARRKDPATALPEPATALPAFADREEQFRHEVYVTWADLVPAGEKAGRPLPAFRVGEDFLDSLDGAGAGLRTKIVRVVVEVLTGWADELGGREVHRLRSGPGGDDPVVVRADGAVCWRAAVQRHTPAARRLHYWRLGDLVELSRVALHDDTRP